MIRIFALVPFLVGVASFPALAETEAPASRRALSRPAPPALPLTLAYFGETITHPGVLLGTELKAWESGWHRAFLATSVGGYRHPGNHSGLFLDGALGYRLTFPAGLSLESLVGIGYLHTLLDGEVYVPDAAGGVEIARDVGRPALMPSVALGLGIDAGWLGLKESRLFTRLQLFGQYPYNSYVLPHVATQVGLTWNFQ